jgi:serine/threonine protein kinase/tetratricopeptide (TPR) repeat protein
MNESQIFTRALQFATPAERVAFLDAVCAKNPRLRADVEALLQAHASNPGFLEAPALAVTSALPTPTDRTGAVIGPYKLLQPIGEGGMGAVYLAEQTHPVQRKVALKLIKPGLDSRQVIARFEAERQALALMDHPNIAKVLDAGTTEAGQPYFVMEFVHGVPLTQYCDEHRLTPRQRLELFVPVCQAIQHAHQKGIIHRDIKPSNVLIAQYDGRPVPKVIDFGVAKATGSKLTDGTMHTEFGSIVGTLEYMSPEQADRNQLDIDTRSDIYSLGVLLYELLTGTTPLDKQRLRGAAILELLRIIKEDEPPKPSTRLSTTDELPSIAANRSLEPKKLSGLVRGELDWIVMKALDKDRERRYETANGFGMDVQRYLVDEPVQACPPSVGYRLRKFARKWVRRHPGLAAGLTYALIAVGIAVFFGFRAHRAEQQRIADRQHLEQELQAERWQRALDDAVAAAMNGDLERAEKALRNAEVAGASTGQVRMLRGLVHFQRGDVKPAVEDLEQAVKLLPHSIAARALMAEFYNRSGQWAQRWQALEEMKRLTPVTPEDYLFKGYAEVSIDSTAALQTLDQAIRLRNTPIARAIRAQALVEYAHEWADRATAERALAEAQVARGMLPDNLYVMMVSGNAYLTAANLYEETGDEEKRKSVLEEMAGVAHSLEDFERFSWAVWNRKTYYEQIGDETAARALVARAAERVGNTRVLLYYAHILYREREFEKALEVLARRKVEDDSEGDMFRAYLLAERKENGPALAYAAYRGLMQQYPKAGPVPLFGHSVLLLLGRKAEAGSAMRAFREGGGQFRYREQEFAERLLAYTCDDLSEEDLLGTAGASRIDQAIAHWLIGLTRLAEGDRAGAQDHFRKAVATRIIRWLYREHCRVLLDRLEKDPAWPPWIPVKKG